MKDWKLEDGSWKMEDGSWKMESVNRLHDQHDTREETSGFG